MMKKILLLAAIGVAGLVSAKSNKSIDEKINREKAEQKVPVKECGVVITYWSGGQVVGQQIVTSEQPDLASCQSWQNGVKVALQIAGYWLT